MLGDAVTEHQPQGGQSRPCFTLRAAATQISLISAPDMNLKERARYAQES
jgi:uncharacterized DUF497 family protein